MASVILVTQPGEDLATIGRPVIRGQIIDLGTVINGFQTRAVGRHNPQLHLGVFSVPVVGYALAVLGKHVFYGVLLPAVAIGAYAPALGVA